MIKIETKNYDFRRLWLVQGFAAPFFTAAQAKALKSGTYTIPETANEHAVWKREYQGALNADFWWQLVVFFSLSFSTFFKNHSVFLLLVVALATSLAAFNWFFSFKKIFSVVYWSNIFKPPASTNPLLSGIGGVLMTPIYFVALAEWYGITCPLYWWFLLAVRFFHI